MTKRLLAGTAAVLVSVSFCFGGRIAFCIATVLFVFACVWEFVEAAKHAEVRQIQKSAATVPTNLALSFMNPPLAWLSLMLPPFAYFISQTHFRFLLLYAGLLVLIVGLCAAMTARAAVSGNVLGSFRKVYGLVALLYIGMLFSSFMLIRGIRGTVSVFPFGEGERGAWLMLMVSVCVWMTDTCAMAVGKRFGKKPLSTSLSPGKTVEGAYGGLAGSFLTAMVFGVWVHLPLVHSLVVGLIAGTAGQVGDLFESALKRELGIKDFGRIMPGHGGLLDRADSMLFVLPIASLYLLLIS